jgi:hypothetical protein
MFRRRAVKGVCLPFAGTAGGEAQHNDIRSLRREIELKKSKLNDLREETRRCVHLHVVYVCVCVCVCVHVFVHRCMNVKCECKLSSRT